jgi:hypothetical protein
MGIRISIALILSLAAMAGLGLATGASPVPNRVNRVGGAASAAPVLSGAGTTRTDDSASAPNRVSAASPAAGGTKVVTITDPILNMQAYSLTIPANWNFDGAVIQGSSCIGLPFSVFRATSPDGLTGIKSLPRLDWAWSENASYNASGKGDCLAVKREMNAAEVMKYMIGVLQVEFVRDDPTPNLATFRRNIESKNNPSMFAHADMASATVHYHVNKITIEDHLNIAVVCSTTTFALLGRQHSCDAFITRSFAPEGKWSDDIFNPIGKSLVIDQQWNQKFTAIMVDNIQQSGRAILQYGENQQRIRTAQNSAFQQAQAMRQKQHEDFDASLKRGTDMSMARANDSMNARSRAADDWCDYSLDQQKRLDPNTGLITKDSSAYNYTWVNDTGDRVQTNNINANPNGNGTGNWTLQENVR